MPRHFASSIALITSLSLCSIPAVAAPRGPFALGLVLGDPNGLNMRYLLGGPNALDASLGWGGWDGVRITTAYVWRFANAFDAGEPNFEWYAGIGGSLWTWNHDHCKFHWCERDGGSAIAAHIPFGLSYLFKQVPIEVFGQISPDLMLIPGAGVWVNAAVGGRFYF